MYVTIANPIEQKKVPLDIFHNKENIALEKLKWQ